MLLSLWGKTDREGPASHNPWGRPGKRHISQSAMHINLRECCDEFKGHPKELFNFINSILKVLQKNKKHNWLFKLVISPILFPEIAFLNLGPTDISGKIIFPVGVSCAL